MYSKTLGGRCLAWYDASLGRWSSPVQIRPTPLIVNSFSLHRIDYDSTFLLLKIKQEKYYS